MSVFTWTPEFGSQKNNKPQVNQIKFGDGYESRITQGINANLKTWSLTFDNRMVSEIDDIHAFLDARAGIESFDWTPPRELTAVRVVCREWNRTYKNAAIDALTATFEQVAEP